MAISGLGREAELDKRDVKNRATLMAIQTGNMPDVELIWSVQRFEGHEECFGQRGYCWRRKACHWGRACGQLAEVEDNRLTEEPVVQLEVTPEEAMPVEVVEVGETVDPVLVAGSLPKRIPPKKVLS